MHLADAFKLSVNSILHRKLRSWLTLLGIVIGVAAVVAIISMGEGMQASVNSKLSSIGADRITIVPGHSKAEFFRGMMRPKHEKAHATSQNAAPPTLKEWDARVILSNHNVKNVNEEVSGNASLVFLAEKSNVRISGVNANAWKAMTTLELASGRFLNSSDSTAIVIGDKIANYMFKHHITIGRRVTIGGKAFTVVGILKPTGSSLTGSDATVYMPYKSAWDVTNVEKNTFTSIEAQVEDTEKVDETVQEITSSLLVSRKVSESKQDFTVTSTQSMIKSINETTQTVTVFLGLIAAISLVVGGIGVANSMFTSVLEKTKIIGILKALGATNREVLILFIIESGLFGLTGGIIGAFLGALASSGLGSITGIRMPMMRGGVNTLVTPELLLVAILLSTSIGILAGVLPARSASKLRPVEALRYE